MVIGGLKLDGVFGKIIRPPVFFSPLFFGSFLFWGGFRSLLTPERLITIHMSHTPHIIRVRETELEYSKGLQGVSSREKEEKVCLFSAKRWWWGEELG